MDAMTAILTRRSVGRLKADGVERELIQQLLEAGNAAPNHHKVRPWRFVVLTGSARERLGDALAASLLDRKPDAPQEALNKARASSLRAPVLIAVGVDPAEEGKTDEIENICAAAAACENILLAAHVLGLGAKWRTDGVNDAQVKELLGFAADQHIVGFMFVGYAESESMPYVRPAVDDRVSWMES